MVFKRKIYDKMLEWKQISNGQTALLVEGARRIGKSTIVEAFAQNEYDDYIILDFAKENKDIKQNFEDNIGDLDTFFRNLFLLKGKNILSVSYHNLSKNYLAHTGIFGYSE